MDFIEVMKRAQEGEETAIEQLIERYMSLLRHHTLVGQEGEEDLFQELCCTMLLCIKKFELSVV